jgi:signal transduction histidine kinase
MNAVSGSSGLGLWISLGLARKMNGDLSYQRESGQTLFELILPAADIEPELPRLGSRQPPTPRSTEYVA